MQLPDTPLANELCHQDAPPSDLFPLGLNRCTACGHVQLSVVADPARLFTSYKYVSGTSPVFRKHLLNFAVATQPKIPGFVLEVASNDGTLLNEFQQLGHRVLGVDPAANLAQEANRQGLPTLPEFFTPQLADRILRDHGPADLVCGLNCFAHIDDLGGVFQGVERVLAGNGRLVFEVGYWPAMMRGRYFDTVYHEHLSYHHLRPLVPFFERLGLRLWDAELVDSQGGSIRCHVMREAAAPPQTQRLAELLEGEESVPAECAQLQGRVAAAREAYHRAVAGYSRVCAFGAPAKCVTLMAAFGIVEGAPTTPQVIFDENPLKSGLYTPAPRIPIRPGYELVMQGKGDYDLCVIFAWNFAEDLRKRYKAFKGRWLVPLPEPRIC